MTQQDLRDYYFEWLYDLVCANRFSKKISYRKLLMHLHNTEFRYLIALDKNRADDGVDLRYRFAYEHAGIEDAESYLSGPCSVLEMMVALALRCEENIMDDADYGNRTGQWFWGMIANLGLRSMNDIMYDRRVVDTAMNTLLDRTYNQDGKGGLFTVKNCERDLRTVEIWHQLCWYLDAFRY